MKILKLIILIFSFIPFSCFAQSTKNIPSTRESVALRSEIVNGKIKLKWYNWYPSPNSGTFTIFRKERSSNNWTELTTVPSSTFEWTDNSSQPNVFYEYRIKRNDSGVEVDGYVATGINCNDITYRGRILIVIDSTYKISLSNKIIEFENDLIGDGWSTKKIYVQNNETRNNVRDRIGYWYQQDQENSKGVVLIGHIPIYPTGNINPDGHNQIPWPADSYYGDMSNYWSSGRVTIASNIELFVGRIDFYGVNKDSEHILFPGKTQRDLIYDYLNKLHQFKNHQYVPENRALIKDNLWDAGPISESHYRNVGTLFPSSSITELTHVPLDYSGTSKSEVLNAMSEPEGWIMGFFAGGGTYDGVNDGHGVWGTGTVFDFSTIPCNVIFTSYVGSYIGNWEGSTYPMEYGNFLKVALLSGKTLITCFNGLPNWTFHNMGMGEPIGYSMKETVNNYLTNLYPRENGEWQAQPYTTIHLSLLGDPTLRMFYIPSPTNFIIKNSNGDKCFSWNSVSEVEGYNVYSLDTNNVPTKLNSSIITETSFQTYSNASKFMVRAVKTNSNNGTYKNMSIGLISDIIINGTCSSIQPTTLSLKGALGGAVQDTIMRNDLETLLLLPLTSPYGGSDLNLSTNNVVDWVKIEILDQNFCSVIGINAIMKTNGNIFYPDGGNIVVNLPSGNYYIKLNHRNHLSLTSANPLYFNGGTVSFDFTTQPLYGGDEAGVITSMGRAMIPGDINDDGKVDYTGSNNDRDKLLTKIGILPTNVILGYNNEDVNLDGKTSYTGVNNDRELILNTIGGFIPSNVITEKKGTCH